MTKSEKVENRETFASGRADNKRAGSATYYFYGVKWRKSKKKL